MIQNGDVELVFLVLRSNKMMGKQLVCLFYAKLNVTELVNKLELDVMSTVE